MDESASKPRFRKIPRAEFRERMLADQELRRTLTIKKRKADMGIVLGYARRRKTQTLRIMQSKSRGGYKVT